MIGKPEWFKIRKYGGWGITPDKKEGWMYLGLLIIPFLIFQILPFWSGEIRTTVTAIWLGVLLVDVTDIMIRLKKDEREEKHEAMAERNAAWFMLTVILVGFLYKTIGGAMKGVVYFDPVLMTALIGGAIVKSVSHWYMRDK